MLSIQPAASCLQCAGRAEQQDATVRQDGTACPLPRQTCAGLTPVADDCVVFIDAATRVRRPDVSTARWLSGACRSVNVRAKATNRNTSLNVEAMPSDTRTTPSLQP